MIARNIIAIGASAGGFEAIQTLVSGFPPDLPAAVFITQHQHGRSEGTLPDLLNRASSLPAMHPWDETAIEMGRIYVAPPDYHLNLTAKTVLLGHGPKENMQRPWHQYDVPLGGGGSWGSRGGRAADGASR